MQASRGLDLPHGAQGRGRGEREQHRLSEARTPMRLDGAPERFPREGSNGGLVRAGDRREQATAGSRGMWQARSRACA